MFGLDMVKRFPGSPGNPTHGVQFGTVKGQGIAGRGLFSILRPRPRIARAKVVPSQGGIWAGCRCPTWNDPPGAPVCHADGRSQAGGGAAVTRPATSGGEMIVEQGKKTNALFIIL